MAVAKTKRSDVVATFHRYIGRNPESAEDWETVKYLMTKAPQEVEKRLAGSVKTIKDDKTEARTETSNIDPIKIAQKLGFTENDFANDPGFAAYWGNKSEAELTEALTGRGDYDTSLGRKRTESEQHSYQADKDWLDSQNLSDDERAIVDGAMNDDSLTSGQRVYSESEWNDLANKALTKARTELEPYYKDLQGRDMEDTRDAYADIRNDSKRYQQQEEKSYADTLAKTKQSLRARGLTFSGSSRATLGAEGALDQKGVEGSVPQQRRYDWEDARASWQESARDIGKETERRYGSDLLYEKRDYLNPEGLPDPYGKGLTYDKGGTAALYNPKKDASQDGYVSKSQADIEREKEYAAQKRQQDRLKTYAQY